MFQNVAWALRVHVRNVARVFNVLKESPRPFQKCSKGFMGVPEISRISGGFAGVPEAFKESQDHFGGFQGL